MKCVLISGALNSFALSLLMTAWVTWRNLGASSDFVEHWISAFVSAWPLALVLLLIVRTPMSKLTKKLVGDHCAR